MQVADALANSVQQSEIPLVESESIVDAFDKLRIAVAIFDMFFSRLRHWIGL